MNTKSNIVIVEDNQDIREGFKLLINSTSQYNVVETFDNCEQAIVALPKLNVDIVLMDIDLPGMNGIEGTREIKNKFPHIEIVIITVFENSNRVFDALCAGATGYLTKNSSHLQLLSALEDVKAGGAPMSANIARMVAGSFHKNTSSSSLSKREVEVLALLVDGKSYKSIAMQLDVSLSTVKFHIKNIYIKLQVTTKEDAISIAKKEKYI